MNNNYFNEIYNDFFSVDKKINVEEISDNDNNNNLDDISKLYLDEESKSLLIQILDYMEKYHNKEEANYINFNTIVQGNNKEIINKISRIINTNKDYINNKNIYNLSLYELNNKIDLNDIYNKNGIIVINDLKGILLLDENNKKLFMYQLKNNLHSKKITLLCGNVEDINLFLSFDNELNIYFNFKLIEQLPSIQDIYNEIISKFSDDKLNIKILDYITSTYKDIKDYSMYRDNLINYLSFHKDVPKVKETKSIDEVFHELNSLVGLNDVKKVLHDLVNLISLKDKSDLKINNVNLHMLFLGNPGTGKTTVARLLSDILYNLGYIKENKLIEVSSKDLVAEYVGQTSIKTYSVIERSLGGILFIDEAYSLSSKNNSYNDEAIATLIKAMEDNRDNLVVIFAGYTKEMNDFINSNSGIASRIGYTLNFVDYTEDELLEIFKGMVKKSGFKITNEALDKVKKIILDNKDEPNFGNARFVRNMFEKSVITHASNVKDNKRKDILITITDKDINIDNM